MFKVYLQDLLDLLVVLSIDDPIHVPLQNPDQVSINIRTLDIVMISSEVSGAGAYRARGRVRPTFGLSEETRAHG